jgi:hypothetical protein
MINQPDVSEEPGQTPTGYDEAIAWHTDSSNEAAA